MSSKSTVSTVLYIIAVIEIVLGTIASLMYFSTLGTFGFLVMLGSILFVGMLLIAFATLVENSARQAERLEEISRKLNKLTSGSTAHTAAKTAKSAVPECTPDGEEITTCKNCGIDLRVGQICPICGKRSN